ncbi:papain-like cysteine protease family protein [Bowmanella denitrificans]
MANERSAVTGKWYQILRQQKDNSCAPACIRMMGIYVNGVDPGEGTTRAYVSLAEGGTSSLGGGGVVTQTGHNFTTTPTAPDPMVQALKSLRPAINSSYIWEANTTQALKDKMAEVKPKNEMIIGVYWAGGGGHVVVGVDRDATSGRIIVADPGYGVRFIESDGSYHPAVGVTGNVVLTVFRQ